MASPEQPYLIAFILFKRMTRIERFQEQLRKVYDMRRDAILRNDFITMSRCEVKAKELEKQLQEAKMHVPVTLKNLLDSQGEDAKSAVYKSLIKCSLAADFLNDCAEAAKSELRKVGANDFVFHRDIDQLCQISKKVASLVIFDGQQVLTDMMVDNDEFIDSCHQAADKHLNETLKL